MKRCCDCGKEKTLEGFYKNSTTKDGYQTVCKPCTIMRRKLYRSEHKEQSRKTDQKHYLKVKYGLAVEEYERLYKIQNGVCAICGNPETQINPKSGQVRTLCVDHDHETGEIRELLCCKCNLLIAHAQEDIEILSRAITYLIVHRN